MPQSSREGRIVAELRETAGAVAHDLADDQLTRAVLASFEQSTDDRFRTVMRSLVKHLHAFVREVELTKEEWGLGIDFITRTGRITTDQRQEFVLLSDVLGVSMLTIGVNNRRPAGATESTVFGPFFVEGSPPSGSRSGRPTTRACTTCSAPAWTTREHAATCHRTATGATGSGRSGRRPTRSRSTGRWGSCSPPPAAASCGRRTSTSWSRPTASRS